jgi:hypothetical protein
VWGFPPRAAADPLPPLPCAARARSAPQIMWAVCVYLEAISVLPQLRMMQNSKVVERFTAHYVFCLGLSRFFSCAHWILQVGTRCAKQAWGRLLGSGATQQPPTAPGLVYGGPRCGQWPWHALVHECCTSRHCSRRPLLNPPPPTPQLLDGNKYLLTALGSGLWPVMVLLSEVVQTFILADFWWARAGGGLGRAARGPAARAQAVKGRFAGSSPYACARPPPCLPPPHPTSSPLLPPSCCPPASTMSSPTRMARASCACP